MIFRIISQYIFIISPDIVGYIYIYIHTYIPIRRFPENGGVPQSIEVMEDHFGIETNMVTWGSPIFLRNPTPVNPIDSDYSGL